MANIYSLQLLRNGSPYASYADAVAGIQASGTTDGTIKLARYYQAGASGNTKASKYNTDGEIKTIFGIYNAALGGKEAGYTIFDATHEVLENLQAQIDSITGEGGSIAEQIQAAINALNYDSYVTGDSKVVVDVTETDGVVAATGQNIANIKLADYTKGDDAGKVAATDTLGQALSKLEKQLEVVSANTADVISGLDYSDSAVEGEYVSQVTETDGVIAVTRVALPSLAEVHEDGKPIIAVSEDKGQLAASAGTINAEYVNVADARELFSSSTVEATLAEIVDKYTAADAALKAEILGDATESGNTLGKLEDRIEALDADAKEYHIVKTTTGLPETIKERYSLVDADGNVSGDTVDIPKDSHIVSITYSGTTQKLTYTYINDSGATASTDVDMSELVLETEFGSGVTVTDHVAHGVVDPASETFLTVGGDGFKLSGVQDAINAASGDVKTKLDELSGKTETLSAKTVTGVEMTGGTANVVDNTTDGTKKITINADGSTLSASTNYTSAQTASAVAAGDSIDTALGKLEAQVAAAKAAATTKVVEGTDTAGVMTIDESIADSGNTYTINLSNIAKADAIGLGTDGSHVATQGAYTSEATTIAGEIAALDAALNTVSGKVDDAQAEIDTIESGAGLSNTGAYVPDATNTYTSGATSLADAIDKLDAAATANKIIAGDGIEITEAVDGTTVAVDLKEATGDWENALAFDNGKLYVDHIDAGTY